jgi:tRNA-modifying protein YgfZ
MRNNSDEQFAATRLSDLGAVRVHGADAVRFLQGQVSNDVSLLTAGHSMLAGLHNPQGRAIALLRLIWVGADDVLAVLPRALAGSVAARLARYVLRAKVKISDVSEEWTVFGLTATDRAKEEAAAPFDASHRAEERFAEGERAIVVQIGDVPGRWLGVAPLSARAGGEPESGRLPAESTTVNREHWRSLDIAAGIPQIYAATSEQFVAQMLNLDVLDAISFTKGCYTGQEVIARAHYRGRVKRRMQRFRTRAPAKLAPGDAGQLADGRTFRVVDAVSAEDGRCEFLAVTTMMTGEDDGEGTTTAAASLEVEALPLPYELPA